MAPSASQKPTDHDLNCLSIRELEVLARERMDKQTRDYYNEGADSNTTLQENMTAYNKYRIRPRVLRDISQIDPSVTVFGHRNTIPMGVAPAAMQALAHPDGELATARACAATGIIMGLSSFSTTTLEDVRQASGDIPNVLQLYLFEEKDHSRKMIQRAKKAGYKAVMLTVDTPMIGRRNLEIRNQFKLPSHLKIANFSQDQEDGDASDQDSAISDSPSDVSFSPKIQSNGDGSASTGQKVRRSSKPASQDGDKRTLPTGPITFHTHAANPTLSWEESIPWLKREAAPMEVWVKGVATGEDAELAIRHSVDGIVVSNHGGRQLNGALATLDALPEVVAAVKKRVPVHVDGGIRHGTDIFKALALGADFCWIGRPVLWGLAYKGQQGVELCLRLLIDEFRLCMGLAGVTRVQDISTDYLARIDRDGFTSRL